MLSEGPAIRLLGIRHMARQQDTDRPRRKQAKQLGVNSTPTFFLGVTQSDEMVKIVTRLKGAQPYASFKRALADAVKLKVVGLWHQNTLSKQPLLSVG